MKKVWLKKKTWLHHWQILNELSKRKANDDAKKMMLKANRMMVKAKAVMLKTQRTKTILVNAKNMMCRTNKKMMMQTQRMKCQAIIDELKALNDVQGPEDGVTPA